MLQSIVHRTARAAVVVASLSAGLVVGCASSSESAQRDALTQNVGRYDPPPAGAPRPRVGVPPFSVKAEGGFGSGSDLNDLAADQMITLLDASGRFRVIERAQLQKLLDEQNLEGIVRPGELAKPAEVRGVQFLLVGRVTNLRVKTEKLDRGFGLGQVGGLINIGAADVNKTETNITTECGVDIRLVEPSTGEIVMSSFSEYRKTDSASAMGVDILGASANAGADIQIGEDDKGKILRLALDDALRKAMPKIDSFVRDLPPETATPAAPATN
jgi:curli biogenesis system outer membrane secretion channel CsgG